MSPVNDKKKEWADAEDDEEIKDANPAGIKERIEYSVNNKGQRVKTTTTVKVSAIKIRVPLRVAGRRNLARFGDARVGEENVTLRSPEFITMEHPDDQQTDESEDHIKAFQNTLQKQREPQDVEPKPRDETNTTVQSFTPVEKKDIYVAPGSKSSALPYMAPTRSNTDSDNTIRVSNLTKSVTEDDLRELFERFGKILRVSLPSSERHDLDRIIKEPRGFAYIAFAKHEDAEQAMQRLQGFGYDHLILKLEWAKPNVGGGGGSGMNGNYVSGYGSQLAQDTTEKVFYASNLTVKWIKMDDHNLIVKVLKSSGKLKDFKELVSNHCIDYNVLFEGLSIVHWACLKGYREILHYLLFECKNNDHKGNVWKDGPLSLLHISCWTGSMDITKWLLSLPQVNINEQSKEGNTPLHFCCWNGMVHVCRHLIKSEAKTYLKNKDGYTPLFFAVRKGKMLLIKYLIEQCGDKNLIENGINLKEVDCHGRTVLHHACHQGYQAVVLYLIQKGCEYNCKDYHGKLPVDLCRNHTLYDYLKQFINGIEKKAIVKTSSNNSIGIKMHRKFSSKSFYHPNDHHHSQIHSSLDSLDKVSVDVHNEISHESEEMVKLGNLLLASNEMSERKDDFQITSLSIIESNQLTALQLESYPIKRTQLSNEKPLETLLTPVSSISSHSQSSPINQANRAIPNEVLRWRDSTDEEGPSQLNRLNSLNHPNISIDIETQNRGNGNGRNPGYLKDTRSSWVNIKRKSFDVIPNRNNHFRSKLNTKIIPKSTHLNHEVVPLDPLNETQLVHPSLAHVASKPMHPNHIPIDLSNSSPNNHPVMTPLMEDLPDNNTATISTSSPTHCADDAMLVIAASPVRNEDETFLQFIKSESDLIEMFWMLCRKPKWFDENQDWSAYQAKQLNRLLTFCPSFATQFHPTARQRALQELRDGNSQNLLHRACIDGNIEVIAVLINSQEVGINPGESDCFGNNAVHYACLNGHFRIVQMLVNHMMNSTTNPNPSSIKKIINASSKSGITPLFAAIRSGSIHIARYLIGLNSSRHCINQPDIERLELINFHLKDNDSYNALHLACVHGHPSIIYELLLNSTIPLEKCTASNESAVDLTKSAVVRDFIQSSIAVRELYSDEKGKTLCQLHRTKVTAAEHDLIESDRWSKWGNVEEKLLNFIKILTGEHLHPLEKKPVSLPRSPRSAFDNASKYSSKNEDSVVDEEAKSSNTHPRSLSLPTVINNLLNEYRHKQTHPNPKTFSITKQSTTTSPESRVPLTTAYRPSHENRTFDDIEKEVHKGIAIVENQLAVSTSQHKVTPIRRLFQPVEILQPNNDNLIRENSPDVESLADGFVDEGLDEELKLQDQPSEQEQNCNEMEDTLAMIKPEQPGYQHQRMLHRWLVSSTMESPNLFQSKASLHHDQLYRDAKANHFETNMELYARLTPNKLHRHLYQLRVLEAKTRARHILPSYSTKNDPIDAGDGTNPLVIATQDNEDHDSPHSYYSEFSPKREEDDTARKIPKTDKKITKRLFIEVNDPDSEKERHPVLDDEKVVAGDATDDNKDPSGVVYPSVIVRVHSLENQLQAMKQQLSPMNPPQNSPRASMSMKFYVESPNQSSPSPTRDASQNPASQGTKIKSETMVNPVKATSSVINPSPENHLVTPSELTTIKPPPSATQKIQTSTKTTQKFFSNVRLLPNCVSVESKYYTIYNQIEIVFKLNEDALWQIFYHFSSHNQEANNVFLNSPIRSNDFLFSRSFSSKKLRKPLVKTPSVSPKKPTGVVISKGSPTVPSKQRLDTIPILDPPKVSEVLKLPLDSMSIEVPDLALNRSIDSETCTPYHDKVYTSSKMLSPQTSFTDHNPLYTLSAPFHDTVYKNNYDRSNDEKFEMESNPMHEKGIGRQSLLHPNPSCGRLNPTSPHDSLVTANDDGEIDDKTLDLHQSHATSEALVPKIETVTPLVGMHHARQKESDESLLHRYNKKIMSEADLWNLLCTFSICPMVCSKSDVRRSVQIATNLEIDVHRLSPRSPRSPNRKDIHKAFHFGDVKYKTTPKYLDPSKQTILSFVDFLKVLWELSFYSLPKRTLVTPLRTSAASFSKSKVMGSTTKKGMDVFNPNPYASQLSILLHIMDCSDGRKKISSIARTATIIPPMILTIHSLQ